MSDIDNEYERAVEYVGAVLSEREKLEQIAEEAAELAQAALKCIRANPAIKSNNPTPVISGEAYSKLFEEFRDVLIAMYTKCYDNPKRWSELLDIQESGKWLRWEGRLRQQVVDSMAGNE